MLETVLLRLGKESLPWATAARTSVGMSMISMLTMELAGNLVDYHLTDGAVRLDSHIFWAAALAWLLAGFLAPLPYNYIVGLECIYHQADTSPFVGASNHPLNPGFSCLPANIRRRYRPPPADALIRKMIKWKFATNASSVRETSMLHTSSLLRWKRQLPQGDFVRYHILPTLQLTG
ncbi:uncharacterized protein F4812DRAFT_468599 [Daldinia caldariorum]|uniref:uncharacterized protein n=1 Tax=Daldinia caldariorum TaxID=326644 RepID=UPI002007E58B|nr:uncharacterized protein F4812DRAFT_468599 [Daldinia caldariorum]KAI1463746.1 hypothetical protein F4812DRAFT_468599 [Daldinia caldariorum]